jgi:phage portal protein BeeE
MTELNALKNAIAEKKFHEEPLAFSIIKYLSETNPEVMLKILQYYDQTIDHQLDLLVEDSSDC